MPKLYIMCGLAFSGKSTLARKIAESTGSVRITFDELWIEIDKESPVPKDEKGWKLIRKIGQERVLAALEEGKSVVYDDNNIRYEHREELRNVANRVGLESIVIYLNTPIEIIKQREQENKVTGARHEVEPENFQKVLEQLELPTLEENTIEFSPEMNIEKWTLDLLSR